MRFPIPTAPILPGATLGLLGGGQLGRMTALAARAMGYRLAVLDPDPQCPAAAVADTVITAPFDDPEAGQRLADLSAVVTYEIERIHPDVLAAVAERVPLRPGADVLACIQDRGRQKRWLEQRGYPLGPWRSVDTPQGLEDTLRELGPCRVKRTQGGFDGRAQARAASPADAATVMADLRGPAVAEQELDLALELSVLVARTPQGQLRVHAPALNWHEDGVLGLTLWPAPLHPALLRRASSLAVNLADDLQMEGLLVVELFLTKDGQLLINELAPRPHNTFHAMGQACETGQFEQFVRAICGLPLGGAEPHGSSVLVNLLGDRWCDGVPDLEAVLAVPGTSLHLYGKDPRPGRKVGHLAIWGDTPEAALARTEAAVKGLDSPGRPSSHSGTPRALPGLGASVGMLVRESA